MEYSKPKILIDIEEYEYLRSLEDKEVKEEEKNLFPIRGRILSNRPNPMSGTNYFVVQDKEMKYGIGVDNMRNEIIITIL